MSNSYLVTVYDEENANVIGIFSKDFKRKPKWINGCCTLTVIAESINEAVETAKKVVKGE